MTADSKPRLSVAMIARDAESTIGASLQSVQSIADEIVVLDTGSTDGTIRVAEPLATRVIEQPWDNNFSVARNHCQSQTTGDWVFWLDAGETLTEQSAAALRQWIDSGADSSKAYMVLIQLPATVQGGGIEQVGRVRLIPRRDDLSWQGHVRESLDESLLAAGISVECVDFHIDRPVSDHNEQLKAKKAQRDVKLAEVEMKSSGGSPRLLNLIGESLGALGQYAEARPFFHTAIGQTEKGSTEMLEAYYGLLTTHDEDADRETQTAVCLEALEVFPFDAQLLCAMGSYVQQQDRFDLAAKAYQTAVEYGQVDPSTWHLRNVGEVAATCLGLTYQVLDNDTEAQEMLEQSLTRYPQSGRLRRQLLDLHIKHGRRKEALECVDILAADSPHLAGLRSAVRGACLASQQNWITALAYLKTAYATGCRDAICQRWLSVSLIGAGEFQEAQPVIEAWLQSDPHNVEARAYLEALAQNSAAASTESPAPSERQIRVDDATPSNPPGTVAPKHVTESPSTTP